MGNGGGGKGLGANLYHIILIFVNFDSHLPKVFRLVANWYTLLSRLPGVGPTQPCFVLVFEHKQFHQSFLSTKLGENLGVFGVLFPNHNFVLPIINLVSEDRIWIRLRGGTKS